MQATQTRPRRLTAAALTAAACGALMGCAPHVALVRHPLAVRLAERDVGADGVERLPSWCEADGTCHVGGAVLLDQRDLQGASLDRGEARATLQLRLNARGLDRLALVTQGRDAAGRLAVVVDRKAIVASSVEQARRDGEIVVEGPAVDIERLYLRLTRPAPATP